MFDLYTDCDPITPTDGELIAQFGLDVRSIREAIADDRARRCPDSVMPAHESWREAGEG